MSTGSAFPGPAASSGPRVFAGLMGEAEGSLEPHVTVSSLTGHRDGQGGEPLIL